MAVPFFSLSEQTSKIRGEVDAKIKEVVDSTKFILGSNVADLEKEVAFDTKVKYAVGVASGTDALHLAFKALDLKSGDEVITTPFTFFATAETISYTGATPVFVDIEPESFNIDPKKIKAKITKKTKAIVPVHLYGLAAKMDEIMSIAKENSLKVVEDSAQAMGAEYNGSLVNSFGDIGCLSFFPTKNLGCFGDGGMVTTNDEKIYDMLKVLRNHGSTKTYHYDYLGNNSRLDELQAGILRAKRKYLGSFIEGRRKNAALYNELLKDVKDIKLPKETAGAKHSYNQYTIRAKDRNKLVEYLRGKGIGCVIYYPLALHLQNIYKDLGYKKGDLPETDKAQDEVVSLPIFPEIAKEQISEVASAIKDFYRK
ncbi:DegT/DnrJ/EryC1/StrS family aminotransferase [Candidatus Margulisiibacteriota bacterium]